MQNTFKEVQALSLYEVSQGSLESFPLSVVHMGAGGVVRVQLFTGPNNNIASMRVQIVFYTVCWLLLLISRNYILHHPLNVKESPASFKSNQQSGFHMRTTVER